MWRQPGRKDGLQRLNWPKIQDSLQSTSFLSSSIVKSLFIQMFLSITAISNPYDIDSENSSYRWSKRGQSFTLEPTGRTCPDLLGESSKKHSNPTYQVFPFSAKTIGNAYIKKLVSNFFGVMSGESRRYLQKVFNSLGTSVSEILIVFLYFWKD